MFLDKNVSCFRLLPQLARPSLQLILVVFFLHYFGLPALSRYQEQRVMVVTSKKLTDGIDAPAVTVCARHPQYKRGWKVDVSGKHEIIKHVCKDLNIYNCIDENTYAKKEIISDVLLGYSKKETLLNGQDIFIEDVTWSPNGKCFTLNSMRKIGPDGKTDRLFFEIYTNLTYDFFIHDPKYFVLNVNPVGMPSLRRKFSPKTLSSHYYRLAVAEVEKLDLPNDPCTSALWRIRTS